MKEKFENRGLTGKIRLTLTDPSTNEKAIWEADKAIIIYYIKSIVTDYLKQGYRLTLRQLYYQLVTKNIIRNHDTIYKKLSSILDDCMYSGEIDWEAIEDRGRVPYLPYSVEGIEDALQDTIDAYRLNRQMGQSTHVELWTEKDAISGILKRVTSQFHIRLVVNKGYTSSSAIYGAYTRFKKKIEEGKKVHILYFGDHDPSGLDMVRDIRERLLFMFSHGESELLHSAAFEYWSKNCEKKDWNIYMLIDRYPQYEQMQKLVHADYNGGEDAKLEAMWDAAVISFYIEENSLFSVQHIGLTKEQIRKYSPPPNPAKITDPRAANYIKEHGKISYEVDALTPETLVQIVKDSIMENINEDMFVAVIEKEHRDKEAIEKFIKGMNEK